MYLHAPQLSKLFKCVLNSILDSKFVAKTMFLDALASLGSMLESESVINVFEILS